jgi:primosomal protein N' (replication factor Y) (superfamily II helicase)
VRVCSVIADVPAIEREFDYLLPDELAPIVDVGSVVRVSLHGRRVRAWVRALDVDSQIEPRRLRAVVSVSSQGPPPEVLELCEWAARRFVGSPIALLRSATPPNNIAPNSIAPRLPMQPGSAFDGRAATDSGAVSALRTVVWSPPLHDRRALVVERLATSGSSLVITADPARADSLVATLRRLGWPAVAWHSSLRAAARTDAWRRAARGGVVVVGGRTAVLAPVPDLAAGVVVDDLDEALQEERQPTWHAREVLAERCRRVGATFAVVSPLPSVVAIEGPHDRATEVVVPSPDLIASGWPRVEIVDLGAEPPGTGLLSAALGDALRVHSTRGALAICLVNRRGRARLLYCTTCRELSRWDKEGSPLVDESEALIAIGARPTVCLHCGTPRPRLLRAGADRLRDDIAALLGGGVTVGAVDADTDSIDPEATVLVGTESVLHRPELRRRRPSFVALIDFDQEILAPRLRVDEQALWLAARCALLLAGRPRSTSMLMVQTHAANHAVVRAIATGALADAQSIDAAERMARRLPPFVGQALLTGDVPAVDAACSGLRLVLGESVVIKGPVGAGAKRRALVEHDDVDLLAGALGDIAAGARTEGRLRIEMDPARA